MNFDMTTPCPECPFRTDRPGYLTPASAHRIAVALTEQQATFTCHKTTVPDDDDDEGGGMKDGPNAQHCAGAAIMLEKMERPNQMMRWMGRLGMYDRRKLDMTAPVVDDIEQFIDMMPCESDIRRQV